MANPFVLKGVYAITDEHLLPGNHLLPAAEAALKNGVTLLQYRRKTGEFRDRVAEAFALRNVCHHYGAGLIINDDVDLCQAVDADGVHLGQSDETLLNARHRLGPQAIIGVSCHDSAALALSAEHQGASYIALGRFFPSNTKPQAPEAKIDNLRTIRQQTQLPIVAIGGVNADNGKLLIDAGADMLAVIHYLFAAPDIGERVRALRALF